MKINKKSFKYIKASILLIGIICLSTVSFFLGLHWHGMIAEKIKPSKLTCYEHNAFWGTFQTDCYSPMNVKQKNFKFSDSLNCSLLTNHQLDSVNDKFELRSASVYNAVTFIKTDYRNFTLKFNIKNNEIVSSFDPGETTKDPYAIIQNDERVASGIRKTKIDDFFGYEYQYIMLSKKTGKGTVVWTNTQDYSQTQDNFVSEFFQCE